MKKPEWLTLDAYHKAVISTMQAMLTLGGIVIALFVLSVHYRNAERQENELDNRIEKLNEFAKRLEKHGKDLEDQAVNLELQRRRIEKQGEVNEKHAALHKEHLDYAKRIIHVAEGISVNLADVSKLLHLRTTDLEAKAADEKALYYDYMKYAILLQRKSATNTDDEKQFLSMIAELNGTNAEIAAVTRKHSLKFGVTIARLVEEEEKAARDPMVRRHDTSTKFHGQVMDAFRENLESTRRDTDLLRKRLEDLNERTRRLQVKIFGEDALPKN